MKLSRKKKKELKEKFRRHIFYFENKITVDIINLLKKFGYNTSKSKIQIHNEYFYFSYIIRCDFFFGLKNLHKINYVKINCFRYHRTGFIYCISYPDHPIVLHWCYTNSYINIISALEKEFIELKLLTPDEAMIKDIIE